MKRRILIITDSLALPRNQPERVLFEETFVARLQANNTNYEFVQLSIGGANLPFLYGKALYYTSFHPDIVLVQAGVVDCALRAFSEFELLLLRKIRIQIPKRVVVFLRKYRKKRYTSISSFKRTVQKTQELFGRNKVYWISIMPGCEEWEKVVPGIGRSIDLYNNVLYEELGEQLLARNATEDWMMSDFHHLNNSGHNELYILISDLLSKNFQEKS